MSMQAGDASSKKIGHFPDPFVPGQYVTKQVELKDKNVPADKAEVPISCLSCVWMNVTCSFLENCEDVSRVFVLASGLLAHGLCNASNKDLGGAVHTYLTVCIAKCLGLPIGNVWVNRIAIFSIGRVRLCGLVFFML